MIKPDNYPEIFRDWHLSVVADQVEVMIASLKNQPKYQDDLQIISNINDFEVLNIFSEKDFRQNYLVQIIS